MERGLPEIEKYNAVCREICEIPSYNALKAEKKISLYFTMTGEVVIAAWAGEKYVFWLSVTKTEDMALNAQIFHHIAYENLEYVTYLSKALAVLLEEYRNLNGYYKTELSWMLEPKRKKAEIPSWVTPFGHCYSGETVEANGKIFAEDVKNYVALLRERCALRESGGRYEAVLASYAEELKNITEYGRRVRLLQELLEAESYLCLSLYEGIRKTYLDCCSRCRELQENCP